MQRTRTPIRRSTKPIKRSPIKRKRRDTRLALADKLWGIWVHRLGACEMCAKSEDDRMASERFGLTSINTLEAHHLIGRRKLATRHHPMGGILLCTYHHKFDLMKGAHQNYDGFVEWLEEHAQGRCEWMVVNLWEDLRYEPDTAIEILKASLEEFAVEYKSLI